MASLNHRFSQKCIFFRYIYEIKEIRNQQILLTKRRKRKVNNDFFELRKNKKAYSYAAKHEKQKTPVIQVPKKRPNRGHLFTTKDLVIFVCQYDKNNIVFVINHNYV